MSLNITGRCNLKCEFCEKSTSRSAADLSLPDLQHLLALAARRGLTVFLGGGEPFLHPAIWEFLRYCEQLSKQVAIVTNGTVLDHLDAERFDLLGRTISMLSISLDSASPAEHDRGRGVPGSFARAVRFIRHPRRPTRLGINCVLPGDCRGAREMIDLAGDLGCSLNFQPLMFASNYPDMPPLDWKKSLAARLAAGGPPAGLIRSLQRYARQKNVVTNLSLIGRFFDAYCRYAATTELFADKILPRFVCFVPFTQIIVEEHGYLAPCSLLAGQVHLRDGDLYENWRQQAVRYRRDWLAGRRYPVCRSCACHFAENYRCSILSYPLANRQSLPWLLGYYLQRVYQREGRR